MSLAQDQIIATLKEHGSAQGVEGMLRFGSRPAHTLGVAIPDSDLMRLPRFGAQAHERRNEKSPAREKWRKGLNTYVLSNKQVILENIHR